MSTAIVNTPALPDAGAIERVLMQGDLSKLSDAQKLSYYKSLCESLGLNPLTTPFQYITLSGRLTLYAKKDATDQLRKRYDISVTIVGRELVDGVYVVTAQARTPTGRTDESIGAVTIDKLTGEARANALMKTETKAKRRVTLSICGLGMLDEAEVDSIPGAVIQTEKVIPPTPEGYDNWLIDLQLVAKNGSAALKETWSKSPLEFRSHLTATNSAGWEAIKSYAAAAGYIGQANA